MEIVQIAHIENDFTEKFGIPRQSGLIEGLESRIVFEEEYRDFAALQGMDGFDYLWLIWGFSEVKQKKWSPMVHPPRLGGNTKMGVFATRSPFRPNPIGLSSVKILGIEKTKEKGHVIRVAGADLMNGSPIYDIKPYVAYSDSHTEARGGFTEQNKDYQLDVCFPEELLAKVPEEKRKPLTGVLRQDPRPSYQKDPERTYGVAFAGLNIRFYVEDKLLTVTDVSPYTEKSAEETMRMNELAKARHDRKTKE